MELTPDVIDFVFRNVGDTTDARKATIKNIGDADLLITDAKLVWRDSLSFSISNNTCDVVSPGDTCSIDVKFNPENIGQKTALLRVFCNDPDDNSQAVRLEGLGLEPIYWDYGGTLFDEVLLGDSAINDYKIKNLGNTNLHIQGVYIQEDDAEDFYYTDLPDTPFTIEEGDSLVFKLIFKPSALGPRSTKLWIYTNDSDYLRILEGTCVEPLFTVEGEVLIDENTPVIEGVIFKIPFEENGEFGTFSWKPLEGNSSFQFIQVPKSLFTFRFVPDRDVYPNYLTTYLGNTSFLEDASKIELNKDTSGIVIELVPVPPPPEGDGDISGNLVDEQGEGGGRIEYGRYTGDGTPVENAMVLLLNAEGEIVNYDYTDASGYFDFQNIPTGSYQFYADYEGYPMDPANETLILDENNKTLEIVAIVENDVISARLAGATGLLTFAEGGFKAYPVPVTNTLSVRLPKSLTNANLKVRLINTLGEACIIQQSELRRENRILVLDGAVNPLTDGLYIMVIETDEAGYYAKIIKRSR
jgi:hypothetical protein